MICDAGVNKWWSSWYDPSRDLVFFNAQEFPFFDRRFVSRRWYSSDEAYGHARIERETLANDAGGNFLFWLRSVVVFEAEVTEPDFIDRAMHWGGLSTIYVLILPGEEVCPFVDMTDAYWMVDAETWGPELCNAFFGRDDWKLVNFANEAEVTDVRTKLRRTAVQNPVVAKILATLDHAYHRFREHDRLVWNSVVGRFNDQWVERQRLWQDYSIGMLPRDASEPWDLWNKSPLPTIKPCYLLALERPQHVLVARLSVRHWPHPRLSPIDSVMIATANNAHLGVAEMIGRAIG